MSITVRKTSKGVTIRTTGDAAQRLLDHLAAEAFAAAAPAAVPAADKPAHTAVTTINVRVRTRSRAA